MRKTFSLCIVAFLSCTFGAIGQTTNPEKLDGPVPAENLGSLVVGGLVGGFFSGLVLPMVWLLFCNAIPSLRKNLAVSYGIANTLAMLIFLFLCIGVVNKGAEKIDASLIVGCFMALGLVIFKGKQAKKKQLALEKPPE